VLSPRIDLAPGRDGSNRFLPWIIGLMVFLAALALTGAMAIESATAQWRGGLAGSMTVVVETTASGDTETESRVEAAVNVMMSTPGVLSAVPLDRSEVIALVEPWLGRNVASADLPIPRLIDVVLAPGTTIDAAELERRLSDAVPGAELDDHKLWIQRVVRLGRVAEAIALAVVFLIAASAAATVVFATRTGLAVQRDVIEVLHLIGARDSYIARQFQGVAVSLALRGGAIGLLLAAIAIAAVWAFARDLQGSLLPSIRVPALYWGLVAALPLIAAAIAATTAHRTVMRELRRLP
jgi:cell division transport system permease protein